MDLRPRSIAATSGTTSPSTPRATACRSRASASRTFTLFVKWRGERVPLVRWRTTIGGWRGELAADGQEYYRYKGSDVGPRVWRHIVAAPVWIPPASLAARAMVKAKWSTGIVHARSPTTTRPAPATCPPTAWSPPSTRRCARGRTARRFFDNGIRTHGSFDYMSLRGRFSHGCHRLYNQLAVRLFTFVLGHRRVRVAGPVALGFRRAFYSAGEVFEMRLPNRGFYYELDPPLPVEVLEGRVKGTLTKPIAGYVPKPGVKYVSRRSRRPPTRPRQGGGGIAMRPCALLLLAALPSPRAPGRTLAAARRGRRRRRRVRPLRPTAARRAAAAAPGDLEPEPEPAPASPETVTIKLIADARRAGARVLGPEGPGHRAAGDHPPARERAAGPAGCRARLSPAAHPRVHRPQ